MNISKHIRFLKLVMKEHATVPLMMVVAIIPMLLVTILSYNIAKKSLENLINNALLSEIKKKVDTIDNFITERKLNLVQFSQLAEINDILSEQPGKTNNSPNPSYQIFTNYLYYLAPKIGLDDVYLIGIDKKIKYNLRNTILLGEDISKNPATSNLNQAFDAARILQMPYLSTHPSSDNSSKINILLSHVARDSKGIIVGVLIFRLNQTSIEKVIKMHFGYVNTEQTHLAMRIDNRPTILISTEALETENNELKVNKSLQLLLNKAINGDMGQPLPFQKHGESFLGVYSYVPQLHLGMLVQYASNEVFRKIKFLQINLAILIIISLAIVAMVVFWIAKTLHKSHMKSEKLLENIFPKFVIEELKEKSKFVARRINNVAIVFIDIVGFTSFTVNHEPEEVIEMLDELFSFFDKLCEKYRLEKIKTIGDAHMSVSGLLPSEENYVEQAIDMGLEAILAVQHYNLDHNSNFSIRVGIDSGNVTSGIIGKQKFSYDLWGNAVNCASRMESLGEANKVQISEDAYDAMLNKDKYIFHFKKDVNVKGFGFLNTYFVESKLAKGK